MAFVRLFLKILAGLLGIFVLIGLFLPSSTTVERSRLVSAPAEAIFPHINNLRAFREWSPWSDIDPATRWTFDGPEEGVGARMTWESTHREVGTGSMRISRSEAPSQVETELEFDGQGGGIASFHLQPQTEGTLVLWRFHSEFGWNLPGRYFGLMMDNILGPFYERGLRSLEETVTGERDTG